MIELVTRRMDEQVSKINQMEKKHRKFESEMSAMNDINRQEASAKDRVIKDCDHLRATKQQLEEQIQVGLWSILPF